MSESIPIFENLSDHVISFDTKEEFERYYNKNKESIDKMKTRGLNKKFTITGYKIGRLKGNIMLYPLNNTPMQETNVQPNTDVTDLLELKLDNISERIKKIESQLNAIIKYLSQHS